MVQTMALSGVASEALRRAKATIRKRKAAPRGALRPGDRRLRQNKTWRRECLATLQKRIDDRAKWAKDQFEEGNGVIEAYAKKSIFFATGGLSHRWTAGCDLGAGASTRWACWMSDVLRAQGGSTAGFPTVNGMKLVSHADWSTGFSL